MSRRDLRARRRAEVFDDVAHALLDLIELLRIEQIRAGIGLRDGKYRDENGIVGGRV